MKTISSSSFISKIFQ